MTAAFSRFKARLANWREWELNPVVVKELRQAVRSWAVTGTLLLLLAILFCASLALLIGGSVDGETNRRLGAEIFQVFTIILTGASLTFIPLYVGVRLAVERQESNLDLLYITTLNPGRIIRGKVFCGVYMAVLFFSACMPFMAFTNLLGGVDLPTICFILFSLFLNVCAAIQVAIFLACLPVSKVFKLLLALFGIIATFSLISPLVFFFIRMMFSGVGAMMVTGRGFWASFLTSGSLILAGVLLLYFLSVALISPPSTNRALPVRIYLTVIWVLGGLVGFGWGLKQGDMRYLLPWMGISFTVLIGSLVVIVSNHDKLSFRVRCEIPAPPVKRALAFLFYNGAAGGLVWLALLLGATWMVSAALLHLNPPSGWEISEFWTTTAALVLYVFAYALTALTLHRRFFSRRPPHLAGVFAVLLPALWAVGPYILFFFLNRLSWRLWQKHQLGNIFNVFSANDPRQQLSHLICAAAWLTLMIVINARWFSRQVKEFRPPEPAAAPATAATVEVPPAVPTVG